MNIKLTIAYDGGPFLGWQKTREGPSIEEELTKALAVLLKEEVSLNCASRTDAGVHAMGQVANFHSDLKFVPPSLIRSSQKNAISFHTFLKSINALLPNEIKITTIEIVENSFIATKDNKGKEYHYWIAYGPVQLPHLRKRIWHSPGSINIEKMRQAAQELVGTHDFRAFCNSKKNESYSSTVRTIEEISIAEHPGQILQIVIRGNQFLYKMVRNIVGTLVYAGRGKIDCFSVGTIIKHGIRCLAGPTAPANGLTLFRVLR